MDWIGWINGAIDGFACIHVHWWKVGGRLFGIQSVASERLD